VTTTARPDQGWSLRSIRERPRRLARDAPAPPPLLRRLAGGPRGAIPTTASTPDARARTVTWLEGQAEAIPLDPAIADTVVTTWTLCSIADPIRALAEVRRVLKPDGRLLFIEHGRAPDPGVRRWQGRLTPTWRRLAGGCRPDRPIGSLLEAAGFELETLSTGYGVGPRPFAYLYRGMARPAGGQPAQSRLTRGHILKRTEVGSCSMSTESDGGAVCRACRGWAAWHPARAGRESRSIHAPRPDQRVRGRHGGAGADGGPAHTMGGLSPSWGSNCRRCSSGRRAITSPSRSRRPRLGPARSGQSSLSSAFTVTTCRLPPSGEGHLCVNRHWRGSDGHHEAVAGVMGER
jgi:hypothetical protein